MMSQLSVTKVTTVQLTLSTTEQCSQHSIDPQAQFTNLISYRLSLADIIPTTCK